MKPTLLAAAALLLAACGTQGPVEPAADPPRAPADDRATAQPGDMEPTADDPAVPGRTDEASEAATPPPAAEREHSSEQGEVAEQADEPPAGTATTIPESGPQAASDPCAGSPTALSFAEGPAPDIAVVPAAEATSPLPDLAVRRINCGGGWVNLRNEIPSDLPVLIWAWAPH